MKELCKSWVPEQVLTGERKKDSPHSYRLRVWESKQRNRNTARHKEPQPRQQETTGKKKKRLGKKQNLLGIVRSVQKAARARGSSGEKSWKRKWEETHAKAVKRGGPQGSAANAAVWIPPLGDAQPGGGEERKTRKGRAGGTAGSLWWW